jgi:hypothetical protein
MQFEESLASKLRSVFGHDRVYSGAVPITVDNDELRVDCLTPCVTFKFRTNGMSDSINRGQCGQKVATYLIEIFGETVDDVSPSLDVLLDEFKGPVVKDDPGAWVRWIDSGHVIHWAEAQDPSSGEDFAVTEAHDILEFRRVLLVITYEG